MQNTDAPFNLKKIAVPAFGPSVLYGAANGAIVPIIALSARELGASIALAGLIAALIGIGSLINNIPAALIASRYGERRAMIGASVFSMLALALCASASHVWVLALGVFMVGVAASVFLLARQSYLTEAVPVYQRARAMSILGGSTRIGMFIGPFAGAAAVHFMGLAGAFWAALVAMFGAGLIAYTSPEMTSRRPGGTQPTKAPSVGSILRDHAKVFLTIGFGVLLVCAMRASRQVVIPLWADHIGLSATAISLIYGLASALEMLVFYPAGKVMDQHGRLWVAIPCALLMGIALTLMPLTTTPFAFILACLTLGFGNGIGTGIVMTLAADASPVHGRTQFLGIWRLISDAGNSGGPALLAGITALASLAAGISTIGLMGFVAAAVFWRWIPRREPRATQTPQ